MAPPRRMGTTGRSPPGRPTPRARLAGPAHACVLSPQLSVWTLTLSGMTLTDPERLDLAIEAAADALLAVCAVQTGTDPQAAIGRATAAIHTVFGRAEAEAVLDGWRAGRAR